MEDSKDTSSPLQITHELAYTNLEKTEAFANANEKMNRNDLITDEETENIVKIDIDFYLNFSPLNTIPTRLHPN